MPTRWRIIHTLNEPVHIRNTLPGYPSLGLSLSYEEDRIVRVEHEFDAPDRISQAEAVQLSDKCLTLFWAILQYRSCVSVNITQQKAEQLNSSGERVGPALGEKSVKLDALLFKPVVLPDDEKMRTATTRLPVWLRLANGARETPSDADAIRNYHMVWEDKHGRPDACTTLTPEAKLKFVRDFVSHGKKLNNSELLRFLQREIGKPVDQYDPTDEDQLRFVRRYRDMARQLIENELDGLL